MYDSYKATQATKLCRHYLRANADITMILQARNPRRNEEAGLSHVCQLDSQMKENGNLTVTTESGFKK